MSEREQVLEQQVAELEAKLVELERIKHLLAARTAVAWMGMASANWRHSIEGQAIGIRNGLRLLQHYLSVERSEEQINQMIDRIDGMALQILQAPFLPSLSLEDEAPLISVNDLLRKRITQLQENGYYDVQIVWQLGSDDQMLVRADPEWLRRVVDILVDNAVEAMSTNLKKTLTISSTVASSTVEIYLSDTGHGVPTRVLSQIFNEPIKKSKEEKGLGMGLLLARTIVQKYSGDIRLASTSSKGTTIIISLPLAE